MWKSHLIRLRGGPRSLVLDAAFTNRSAFSLVEVVLAISVVSFALLALIGLLSVGLQNSRESDEDTKLALCAETVQELLRSEGFAHVLTNAVYASGGTTPVFFFDDLGVLQTDPIGRAAQTANASSHFGCIVTRRTLALDQPTTNLLGLQLKFVWPLGAPAARRQQSVILEGLANDE